MPLENLISLAIGEMYLNRLREGDQDADTSSGVSDVARRFSTSSCCW